MSTKDSDVLDNTQKFTEEQPPAAQVAEPTDNPKAYSEEDLRRVREQEKSKLYPQIESLKEELNALKEEKEARAKEEERLRLEAEAENRRREEENMDVRDLLGKKEQEFLEMLNSERQEREKALALLEQERHYNELQAYRTARLEEERDNIMPELLDLITGNSADEIESSIAGLKERTSRILESAQAAMSSARQSMTGSKITAPPSGPLDTNSEQQQFTAEQIANMSVTEYAKYRGKLLGNAASDRGKGLFS